MTLIIRAKMPSEHLIIANAKIYKIIFGEYFYYGCTIQSLSKRFGVHKALSKLYPDRKLYKTVAGKWDEVKIEIVERVKCNTHKELRMRENEYIKTHISDEKCMNMWLSTCTPEEKKAKNAAKQRVHRQVASEEIKEQRRQRANELRRDAPEEIKKQRRQRANELRRKSRAAAKLKNSA